MKHTTSSRLLNLVCLPAIFAALLLLPHAQALQITATLSIVAATTASASAPLTFWLAHTLRRRLIRYDHDAARALNDSLEKRQTRYLSRWTLAIAAATCAPVAILAGDNLDFLSAWSAATWADRIPNLPGYVLMSAALATAFNLIRHLSHLASLHLNLERDYVREQRQRRLKPDDEQAANA